MKTLLNLVAMTAAIASAEQLHITVYDKAQTRQQVIEDVNDQLRRIFRHAGIEADIAAGDPASAEASLVVYRHGQSQSESPYMTCRGRRDIAVDILPATPPGMREQMMAFALPCAEVGLNVRVFADRVSDLASVQHRPYAIVLAHVIAHECGHVLLRTNAHGTYGLMARVWETYEFELLKLGHMMFFTREQSQRMRATLTGDDCEPGGRTQAEITAIPRRP